MVAFVGSLLVAAAMVAVIVTVGMKRPADTPVTWGEAMVGAVLVFFCFFWAYGVVPQTWILWSANELKWRPDQFLTGAHGTLLKGPVALSKAGLGDIITVLIYGLMVNLHIGLFIFWNKRARLQADQQRTRAVRRTHKGGLLSRKGQLS